MGVRNARNFLRNYIGDWLPTEGYYINVNGDVNFEQTGMQIDIPLAIALNAGWNIISYPCYDSSQDALAVVQPLIDSGYLVKVIDERGNSIIYLLGEWRNYIGDMSSGEGYYVNVNTNCTLDMTCGGSSSAVKLADGLKKSKSQHFNLTIVGNPYKPMSIFIASAQFEGEDLMMCDEVAVYDGDRCVGVSVLDSTLDRSLPLQLIAYQGDGDGKGFTEGNEMIFRVWRNSTEEEYMLDENTVTYLDQHNGDDISRVSFQGLGTAVVTFNVSSVQDRSSERIIPKEYCLYQNYPNPFNPTTNITYDLPEDTEVRVEIYNVNGNLIKVFNQGTQAVGRHVMEWDGRNRDGLQMASGLYFYRLSTKKFIDIKKMILIK